MGRQDHRRNLRVEEVRGICVTPHFLKWGYCTPTFKRYKSPSFELKVRSAWVAGALPPARLRARLLKGRQGVGGKVEERGRGGMSRGSRGKWYPHFTEESYALVKRLVGLGLRLVVAEACHAASSSKDVIDFSCLGRRYRPIDR